MIWEKLTSEELGQLDRSIPVVLPIAAIEQHGPHLPLATDRLIGEYFCLQLDQAIPEGILVLPAVAIGYSEHHLDFPGSLSITHETMLLLLTDIFNTVKGHGFTNLVLFNSHGGNMGIGQVFMEKYGYRNPDVNIHLITWWKVVAEKLRGLSETGFGGVGHAGEFETSLIMLIKPDLLREKKMEEGYPLPTFDWARQDMLHGPAVGRYGAFARLTKKGTFGDPTKGSAEKGARIASLVINACTRILSEIKNDPSNRAIN